MNKLIPFLFLFAFSAYGQQQKRIAIINIVDDGSPSLGLMELGHLTDRLHSIASETLPGYAVVSDSGEIADYLVRGRIGRFGEDFTIKVELRDSSTLLGVFSDNSKDIYGLLAAVDGKAPAMFKKLLPSQPSPVAVTPVVPVAAPSAEAPAPKPVSLGYTGTNKCYKEIFDLTVAKKDFSVSSFVKDLGISVAKVQASCKTKWTCPADDKITDVGLTAGCVKQLPLKPDGIISLLKDIGIDAALNAVADLAQPVGVPESIDPQVKSEKSGGGSFWVAFAFDLVGIGLISYGVMKNGEASDFHSDYRNLPSGLSQNEYNSMWKRADEARSTRNTLYIVGGLVLATGIGVHIWF